MMYLNTQKGGPRSEHYHDNRIFTILVWPIKEIICCECGTAAFESQIEIRKDYVTLVL